MLLTHFLCMSPCLKTHQCPQRPPYLLQWVVFIKKLHCSLNDNILCCVLTSQEYCESTLLLSVVLPVPQISPCTIEWLELTTSSVTVGDDLLLPTDVSL